MITNIKNLEEFDVVSREAAGKLIVVEFTHSRIRSPMSSVFDALSQLNEDAVFLRVDCHRARDVYKHCNIEELPVFRFYKNGQKLFEYDGVSHQVLFGKVAELK